MTDLAVFWEEERVGRLKLNDDQLFFEYDETYLQRAPRPLSASLPLTPSLIRGSRVSAFFGNLLPEGDIRNLLSQQYRLDQTDDLGLLAKLGTDCAGALVIKPEGKAPLSAEADFEQRYQKLDDEYELGQYLHAVAVSPTAAFKGVVTRLSLAGAQSKTAIALFEGNTCYRSLGGATTHIIKLGSRLDQYGKERFPGLVFNEYFCSKLAAACAIPVPKVLLLPVQTYRDGPLDHVFAIERYDRVVDLPRRRVRRVHQEDLCQALGRPRTQKYEGENGVTLENMFGLMTDPNEIDVPALSRSRLLDLVLFNLLLGNRDSHAKNYSLLRGGARAQLAPAYDLVCTELYTDIDTVLPQRIGTAEQFKAITAKDLEVLAEQIKLRPQALKRQASRISSLLKGRLPAVVKDLVDSSAPPAAIGVAAQIEQNVARNIEHLDAVL